MARDQEPVTASELEELREELTEQREQIREDLATDLGGVPDDYNADTYRAEDPVADGGSE